MTFIPKMPIIDLNPHDWEEVKRILGTHVPQYEVVAFGSRVKWTAKAYSDLDLAIISNKPLSLSTVASLKDAFDESTLAIKVDVVDWATTSEFFRQIIESGKITIQAASTATERWSFRKLIDCTSDRSLSYGIVQPGQHVQNGIPIVRVNNFNNGRLQCDDVMRVSPDIEKKFKRTRLEGGEVLLTLIGTTGQSAVVPKEMAGWNIALEVAVIRPKPEVGANWINICLQTKNVQQFLDERATTTVQKTLNLGDVREIPIPVPPKDIKENIETFYLALTNKIELNRQINQTLEQIAQAIFNSWFVDFEPVKAKIKAKQALTPTLSQGEREDIVERAAMCAISGKADDELDQLPAEQRQQLAATASLFPAELMESELALIPNGWETRKVESLLSRLSAKIRYTKDQVKSFGMTPVFEQGAGILLGYHDGSAQFIASQENPAFIFGDHTCVMHLACEPFDISQNVIPLKGADRPTLWAYYAVKDKQQFQEYRRHWMELVSKDVIVPTEPICQVYADKVSFFHLQMEANVRQSREIRDLRDTLLPKLLSGEIEINQVD